MGQEMQRYYLGLDMGTSSLGWAVTNPQYDLLRARGKDLWGVRSFQEASTAEERRTNRVSRRRRQREVARIGLLKDMFADAINSVDPGFLQRCEESMFHLEDKSEQNRQSFALFCDTGFTDVEYYKKYPTIFHLRKELIESQEVHDVRLVYLAVLNMFKHRGHFLNASLGDTSEMGDVQEYVQSLCEATASADIQFPSTIDATMLETVLTKKDLSRTAKAEAILKELGLSKAKDKTVAEIIKLLCGLKANTLVLFNAELAEKEDVKKAISFSDSDYEGAVAELEKDLCAESMEVLESAKNIYDTCLLSNLRKGYQYLSQARVADYQKHKEDLHILRALIKEYLPEQYDDFFRKMGADNYSGYVGSVNSKEEKQRRNGKVATQEVFYSSVKKLLAKMPQEDRRVEQVLQDIANENFMPKQLTASNGVIPNQLHLAELKVILENASTYLPFLNETDESGLTTKERIAQLFAFQIPYYVGPLNDHHKGNGGTAWVVRSEQGTVYPWNLKDKVDTKASQQEFIQRMLRQCTYLNEEKVLPKNSLLYEKYMVLNELNNLRIRGEKSTALKQQIYTDLFMTGKKVSGKTLFSYLVAKGILEPDEKDAITGIDGGFQTSLSSFGKFYGALGERAKEWNVQKAIEDIIFWATIYANDKKVVKECILETYPDMFSDAELKRILGFKFRDWGRLSKEFLQLEGASKETGEVLPLISALWQTDDNLMELLSERYTYTEELEKRIHTAAQSLSEFDYEDLDGLYLSAPVKRMVWQTLLVLKDLKNVLKQDPEKIFVEMARGGGEAGKRTVSRKKKFEELYKQCKHEERDWLKDLEHTDESAFRSKKLYLYYIQKGRCMYTGERIELSDLFNDNLYDIDHIYPRHFVKDDNIDNNLVLVQKTKNAHKSDTFPLENDIQCCQSGWWKMLHDQGFINDEKYKRLTRTNGFSDKDLAGFISRQLVETHQGTKVVSRILKQVFPQTEIVFPKGQNVSDFRQRYGFYKARNVNDFHHAQDAYLNIVVGNAYYTKFTKSPLNFIQKEYNRDKEKYAYHMENLFKRTIMRGNETAWVAATKEEPEQGSIVTVRKVMAKNTPLMTRMNFEGHGAITKATVYSAKDAVENVYLPLKSSGPLSDVTKYGGTTNISTAYFMLVEHGPAKKRIRTIEMVPIYLKDKIESSDACLMEYCETILGLEQPDVRVKKIKLQSLVKWNGFYLHVTGRTGSQLIVRNAMPLCLNQDWVSYVKLLGNYVEKGTVCMEKIAVTTEKNIALYHELLTKHVCGIYAKKPNPIGNKLSMCADKFNTLELLEQAKALLEILKMTECNNLSMQIEPLNLKATGMKIGNNISKAEELLLIHQSPSGLYESVVDLKTV